jgi:hypothetical protein
MRAFGIRPIILVRRIDDIVVSLMQDMKRKQQSPTLGTGQQGYSFIWLDESVKNLGDERLLDMIIDLALPWFVNFYVSWQKLCDQRAVEALWVSYEEMLADKENTLRKVLAFVGFPDFGPIEPSILAHEYPTFRTGRIGSGATVLSSEQRRRIHALFSHYPGVDFARYGL